MRHHRIPVGAVSLLVLLGMPHLPFAAAQVFVNFETPQVHPVEITPDGQRLLVVNTADNRLEIFSLASGVPMISASVPVGLEPVSVRARSNAEAWVVNQISDSVSVVDLLSGNVVATLKPGDEPADVVFAGSPPRAFVSVSQENLIRVFDPASLLTPPTTISIAGEDPRALATDGVRVYAAIFESGNDTTIISQQTASSAVNPYPNDQNPPPNFMSQFEPPLAPGLPPPPAVGIIVKKSGGIWFDDNIGDWSAAVTWDLHDHDVAIIDASTLSVSYVTGLMNANMALSVSPSGRVFVVGTDATNDIRFEPNVRSTFVRVVGASFDPVNVASKALFDLNPHLNYALQSIPFAQREQSIGDPRAIAWNAAGTSAYVAGLGSNNVIVMDSAGNRLNRIEVGRGPTGIVVDQARNQAYVLNRFDASISVIGMGSESELARIGFFDPTPPDVRNGRPFLYDTHAFSGLGQASCASCHIDGRMDQLAWDLGDPQGAVKILNQPCQGAQQFCNDWHPMKGPMTTQTLFGLQGVGGLHWRADRENLAAFNPAFPGLLGADAPLTSVQMAQFEAFVFTLTFPPNPNRTIFNELKASLPTGGNPLAGFNFYVNQPVDGPLTCNGCHALPTGTNGQLTPGPALQESQAIKIPHLRNMLEKTGFSRSSSANNRGFGFTKDGSIATLMDFLQFPGFNFAPGATGQQQRRDLEAFMFSFPVPTHSGVGTQVTVVSDLGPPSALNQLLTDMVTLAESGVVGLVVHGVRAGAPRGWRYDIGGVFQSDRATEFTTVAALRSMAMPGAELTWMIVPADSQTRIALDRDQDGYFNTDERDAGSDPADPNSTPPTFCIGNANTDNIVDFNDINAVIANWLSNYTPGSGLGDANNDGIVDFNDINAVIANWLSNCP